MSVISRQWLAQRPYVIAIVITLALVLWMASGLAKEEKESESSTGTNAEMQVPKVKIETIIAEQVTQTVQLYGRTEPDRVATLKAEVRGSIEQVFAKRGATVKKGQVIAKIALNDAEHRLSRAKAELVQREIELEGAKRLHKDGYQGDVQLSQARAALAATKAEIKRIELDITHTTIVAPFDGILNTRYVEQGDYVKDGDRVAMIADLSPLIVRAHVTEQQIADVAVGQKASIKLLNNREANGVIRYIASVADEATNTFKIEVAIPNENSQLKAGLSSEVDIALAEINAIKVSPALLALDEVGNVGVKSVEDGYVKFTDIDIVKSESDGIWLSGFGEQADIITLGQGFVRAGDKVEAVKSVEQLR